MGVPALRKVGIAPVPWRGATRVREPGTLARRLAAELVSTLAVAVRVTQSRGMATYSRRHFLGASALGLAALPAAQVSASTASTTASASRPAVLPAKTPGKPFVYPFRIGAIEAWSISDGHSLFNDRVDKMHPPGERPRMVEELAAHGERLDGFALYVNVLVLRIGREVVVCDAGFGQRPNPNLGWLADGLASIGIRPEDVTQAFISHGHSDHIGGFVTAGRPTFPNAAVRVLGAEVDFWRSAKPDFSRSLRRDNTTKLTNDVRAALDVLAPNLQLHQDGDAVLGGAVTMVAAPGHTAGHAMLRIRDGDASLVHIMDVAHHHLLMFADPTWYIEFDHEPEQAVATRRRVFAELAGSRQRTYGFHLPWPGLGHILPRATGYRWEPERWSWGS